MTLKTRSIGFEKLSKKNRPLVKTFSTMIFVFLLLILVVQTLAFVSLSLEPKKVSSPKKGS